MASGACDFAGATLLTGGVRCAADRRRVYRTSRGCLIVVTGFLIIAPRMESPSVNYRRLDAQKIIETVEALHQRVERRFPGSGLGKVVAELLQVAQETVTRAKWIQKPHLPLRCMAVLLSLAILTIIVGLAVNI